ncbi:MAG: acyl-CoA thioesterase [Saprospiraceae bacterium]
MLSRSTQLRVRYAETDQMGYVYHGTYVQYYEVGRVEALRSMGLSYKQMEEDFGVMMPVVSLSQRFVRPATYDDLLTITTVLRKLPEMFITFHFEVKNEAGKVVNGGEVRLCFLDAKTRRPVMVPEYLLERIKTFWEEN